LPVRPSIFFIDNPPTTQSYAESLRERNIVDADTIHTLFPALGKLTDFQRKLLIHIEATAERGIDEQDWGQCFARHEAEFAIYDAYIANYTNALDLAVAEQQTLMVSIA
jgi:cell division control protein 24